jgi:prepilin-type processing-associated H-X9-DG protein
MISSLVCPRCGAAVDAGGSEVGSTVACTQCGKKIDTRPARSLRLKTSHYGMILFAALGVVAIIMVWQTIKLVREAACQVACPNNLKQLALAIQNYESANHCFPPAFVVDKHGKRMHSWRALVLPYLDGVPKDLAAKYNYDEPWDSPGNREVADVALRVFKCWKQPNAKEPTTSYMMVVGPHTISDGPHSTRLKDVTDGQAQTIMLVEVADSGVGWAEPKDLEFDKIDFQINGEERPGISSQHSGGANIAMCDGSVRWVSDTIKPVMLIAMLTIDGGEKIREEDLY